MQTIEKDLLEMKYYKRCVEKINNKYPLDATIGREDIIDICDLCIESLVQDFNTELNRYKSPIDIFQFMLLYSKLAIDKQRTEDTLILMQMCRNIIMCIPKLNLSTQSAPIINIENFDLSELFFITKMIDILAQQRAIQRMNDKCVFYLERNKYAFALIFMDDSLANVHNHLKNTIQSKFLFQKHCFTFNVLKDFRDELYNAFGDVVDELCEMVCNTQPLDFCLNDISFSEFKEIVEGHIPERLQIVQVINISKLVERYSNNDFLQGLIFTFNNSDIKTAIEKPYDKELRTRYRPIIEFCVDGNKEYYITPYLFQEAIEEICGNLLPFQVIPNEWSSNQVIKDYSKKLFQGHNKWLEDLVVDVAKQGYPFLRNVKSINNISLEKSVAYIGSICFANSYVGEIDCIVIDESKHIVFVIDAKLMKTRYHLQSFAADRSKFIKEKGYDDKLSFKVDWIQKHLYDISKELKCDCSTYSVQGIFVTETFVYYSFSSKFPIIPIAWLNKYLETNDELCFLQ